ncbi:PRC-barrel domain-containing protein [Flaviflagellibacter deserti]|uniref:PRC-barrel domain-containing protein n=1 Tax=Flaviflagellibacter deserti TaxID=2267266 RepID=A0ABV9Z3Y6_9HYPH
MLKRLLLTSAALSALATAAVAQAQSPAPADTSTPPAVTSPAAPADNSPAGVAADAQTQEDPNLFTSMQGADVLGENDASIGSLADVLLSPDGTARQLVIAHGGIVGIGQTYRLYDVSELPALDDGKVKITQLSTASLEGLPEYEYPSATETGRASTTGAASTSAPAEPATPAPAPSAAAASDAWPASSIVGANLTNTDSAAEIQDLRFEGNKISKVLIDKGATSSEVAEVAFADLDLGGSPGDPQIGLKSAAGGLNLKAPDAAAPTAAK